MLNEVMKGLPWWLRFLAPKAEGTDLILIGELRSCLQPTAMTKNEIMKKWREVEPHSELSKFSYSQLKILPGEAEGYSLVTAWERATAFRDKFPKWLLNSKKTPWK